MKSSLLDPRYKKEFFVIQEFELLNPGFLDETLDRLRRKAEKGKLKVPQEVPKLASSSSCAFLNLMKRGKDGGLVVIGSKVDKIF